jgi:protein-S-isoprenylcysteine O-methyltransferase Ste14
MRTRADSPGVAFPPPFVYAAAVVGGYLLDRRWSLPVHAGLLVRAGADLVAALALVLMFGSIGLFWHRRTSIIPNRPADTLVIRGPYRFTRNPMYVGLALLTASLGVLLDTWWPIMLLLPALTIIQLAVIGPEEQYLRRRFGGDYDAYVRTVRRWV